MEENSQLKYEGKHKRREVERHILKEKLGNIRSGWFNCVLRGDEAVSRVSIGQQWSWWH